MEEGVQKKKLIWAPSKGGYCHFLEDVWVTKTMPFKPGSQPFPGHQVGVQFPVRLGLQEQLLSELEGMVFSEHLLIFYCHFKGSIGFSLTYTFTSLFILT